MVQRFMIVSDTALLHPGYLPARIAIQPTFIIFTHPPQKKYYEKIYHHVAGIYNPAATGFQ